MRENQRRLGLFYRNLDGQDCLILIASNGWDEND
jgi:hypothetical protein